MYIPLRLFCLKSLRKPIRYGLTKPARFPMELTAAMPAAAALPRKNEVGSDPEERRAREHADCSQREERDGDSRIVRCKRCNHEADGSTECRDHQVPAALAVPIGTPSTQDHHDDRYQEGNGTEQSGGEIVLHTSGLHQRGHPEREAVLTHHETEIDRTHRPDAVVLEDSTQRVGTLFLATGVGFDIPLQHELFLFGEPLCFADPVIKKKQ
jgi:hypothetical protein